MAVNTSSRGHRKKKLRRFAEFARPFDRAVAKALPAPARGPVLQRVHELRPARADDLFNRGARAVYRFIWLPFTMIGALGKLEVIWSVSDTLNGLMAIPNLIAIIALGGIVAKRTKEFLSQYLNGNRTGGYGTPNTKS